MIEIAHAYVAAEGAFASAAALGRASVAGRPPSVWDLVTLGGTLAGCIVGGLVVGLLLDQRLDALPVYTLVGIAVGIVSGGAVTYLRMREFLRG